MSEGRGKIAKWRKDKTRASEQISKREVNENKCAQEKWQLETVRMIM